MNAFELHHGDCLAVLSGMASESVDAIVTDPPYGLSFMGKRWDYDVPSVDIWAECLRVLKPGGHLLAFAGTRTQHRMAVRIEDAGFEIRDMIAWIYGSGFPKSLDVSKAIDKVAPRLMLFAPFAKHYAERRAARGLTHAAICEAGKFYENHNHGGASVNWEKGHNVPTLEQWRILKPLLGLSDEWTPLIERIEAEREVVAQQRGAMLAVAPGQENDRSTTTIDITAPATDAARQWQGWGTALKPALEPITVARKPLAGTVAENVQAHGVGALNIDGCRVGTESTRRHTNHTMRGGNFENHTPGERIECGSDAGRWPANLIHDGSDEVLACFPQTTSGKMKPTHTNAARSVYGQNAEGGYTTMETYGDSGSAARFFYCAKASKADRGPENVHPTVKPTDLMRYLCRLVTPPGGVVLDPFTGSGSTGKAAILEGFRFVGIEREAEYVEIARARIQAVAPVATPDAQQSPQLELSL